MTISGKKRGILQHLKDIKPAVMTVGGYLMPRIYMVLEYHQAIESSKTTIQLLWDPWSHGDWARNSASAVIETVWDSICFFQKNIEANFFVIS
jgi:predicted phosphoadenosine phosphosulfate sulfurtransferase